MNRLLRIISLALGLAVVGVAGKLAAQTGTTPDDPSRTEAVPRSGPDLGRPSSSSEPAAAPNGQCAGGPLESPLAEPAPMPGEVDSIAASANPFPAATASRWNPAEPPRERSEQLEQIAEQADRQICHAMELADRGALFAAQADCLGALRLLAEGLDAEQRTAVHVRALAAAVTAMKESDDFLPRHSQVEAELDVTAIVATHATAVLKAEPGPPSPLAARKCYLSFAQEQLAVAAGAEVAGSMALRTLGKVQDALGRKKGLSPPATEAKAVVCLQAALLVNRNNFHGRKRSRRGVGTGRRLSDARRALEYSVAVYPASTSWHNLAVVYHQLDQRAMAERAERQAAACQRLELARRTTARRAIRTCDGSTDRASPGRRPIRPTPGPQPASSPGNRRRPLMMIRRWCRRRRRRTRPHARRSPTGSLGGRGLPTIAPREAA